MHLKKQLFIAAFALAWGTTNAADTTHIGMDKGELVYSGDLAKEANQRLFALYDRLGTRPSVLAIRSDGGDTDAGLDLAQWVRANKLNVKVTEHCLSSCANYVFPAGTRKIVSNVAVIGFHGGINSTSFRLDEKTQAAHDAMTKADQTAFWKTLRGHLQPSLEREQAFYKMIGVRQDITTYGQEPRLKSRMENAGFLAWTYTEEGFRHFGVDGIEVIDGPWRPAMRDPDIKVAILDVPR